MIAKDTAMSHRECQAAKLPVTPPFTDDERIALAQAEITWPIAEQVGMTKGVQSVIDYLENEIATQDSRTAGKPELKAHLNAVEKCVLQTIINAIEESKHDNQ